MRNDLFAHLQRLPQSFFQRWRTGDLMSRCVNDLGSVRLMLGPGALSLLQTPMLFAFVIIAMFSLNPTLAVLVLVPYPLFLFVARGFGRTMHRSNLDVQEGLGGALEPAPGVDRGHLGREDLRDGAGDGAIASRSRTSRSTSAQLRLVRVNASMPAITSMLPAFAMWIVLLGRRDLRSKSGRWSSRSSSPSRCSSTS